VQLKRVFTFSWQLTGLLAALLIQGLWSSSVVSAESIQDSITLSPPSKHLDLKAGQVLQDEFTVINYGEVAYDFVVYTAPYSVKDESYTPNFIDEKNNADAYRWVSFSQSKWHAEPKQTLRIPYSINVSPGAAAGGHYGVIFVETQPQNLDSQGVARKKRLALLLYANVSGPTETRGSVLSVDTSWYQSVPPITSTVRVQNTGKTDFTAKTNYAVFDLLGNIKYQTSVDVVVLPGTVRAVDFTWDKPAWVGVYKVHSDTTVLEKNSSRDSYVIVAPLWLLVLVAMASLISIASALRKRGSTTDKKMHFRS
jgi:hypothetical protein